MANPPSAAPRVRLDLDERREQLVRVGLDLFSHHSYDAVSIDEIATRAKMSKGLLYHYFPSKRDFYVACLRTAARELRDQTAPDHSLPPRERLRASVDAYLDYVEYHAEGFAALMRGGIGSDAEVREIVDESRAVSVERAVAALPLRSAPTPQLQLAIEGWTGYVEATSLAWLERSVISRESLLELLASTFVAIVGAAAHADPGLELDLEAFAAGG
jgi:AcrR family transcriptional regulator